MRVRILLAASGALIAAGLALAVAGSQVVLEGLSQGSGVAGGGGALEVRAGIEGGRGVYAVQLAEFSEGGFYARVYGPSGMEVASAEIGSGTFEAEFDAHEDGEHLLVVDGPGGPSQALGAIGIPPDEARRGLGVASMYPLVAGMALLVGTAAYGAWRARSV